MHSSTVHCDSSAINVIEFLTSQPNGGACQIIHRMWPTVGSVLCATCSGRYPRSSPSAVRTPPYETHEMRTKRKPLSRSIPHRKDSTPVKRTSSTPAERRVLNRDKTNMCTRGVVSINRVHLCATNIGIFKNDSHCPGSCRLPGQILDST